MESELAVTIQSPSFEGEAWMSDSLLPWVLFIAYGLVIVGLTWWNRRKASSMSDFAVGSRSAVSYTHLRAHET